MAEVTLRGRNAALLSTSNILTDKTISESINISRECA